ncbi:MAG: hypothetical protein ACOH5I_02970 [Oligoflexus sp.]
MASKTGFVALIIGAISISCSGGGMFNRGTPQVTSTGPGSGGANPGKTSNEIDNAELGTLNEGDWHLTFEHLDISTIGLDEQGMSFGLGKALNSVSQVSEVIKVLPIEGSLSYSVDPKKFGFTSAQQQAVENCQHMQTTQVDGREFWQADTFMYCILEPRIYYQMMGIAGAGNIERATEELYLKTERTSQNHTIVGVRTSDVANGNNRLMQRIERPDGGVYWGTGDFLLPNGIARALESGVFPAQNAGRVAQLKAGEFMWDMDNGFIGYALSGFAAQARYEANINVASDPSRDDGLVIAGYGCMACHATGYNAGIYIPVGQGDPNASYPSEQEFLALVQSDNERFLNAMRKLGFSDEIIRGPEPITAIIRNFESRTGTEFVEGGATGAL